jgi:hypothetical protein
VALFFALLFVLASALAAALSVALLGTLLVLSRSLIKRHVATRKWQFCWHFRPAFGQFGSTLPVVPVLLRRFCKLLPDRATKYFHACRWLIESEYQVWLFARSWDGGNWIESGGNQVPLTQLFSAGFDRPFYIDHGYDFT